MQVKNKSTGEIEFLRHGPATDAVTAGTHAFVNVDEDDKPKPEKAKVKPDAAKAAK